MKTYIHLFLSPDNGIVVLLSGDNENMHTPFPVRGQWDSCPHCPGTMKTCIHLSCPRTMRQLSYCPGTMKTCIHLFLTADNWDSCPIVPDNENSGKRIFLQYSYTNKIQCTKEFVHCAQCPLIIQDLIVNSQFANIFC